MTPHILVVDDDRDACELLVDELGPRGYTVQSAGSGEQALARLAEADFDAVVTDLRMKSMNGLELCQRIVANRPGLPVIVVTAFGSLENAVNAMRSGAEDFIIKPFDVDLVALTLGRVMRQRHLHDELRRLKSALQAAEGFGEITGESPAMKRLFAVLARVAESDASVLVTGESGTGKELVARSIHQRSPRAGSPFVAVNCAAMPEALLESELFGHIRGAFTDAKANRAGLFVEANTGTIFLDEVGELPLHLQPKLLRALQERVVRPVGANTETPFDVRVIAATNRDLDSAVEDGRFREDLFYRLNVVQVELPPLRARGNDVLLLAESFLQEVTRRTGKGVTALTSSAAEKLLAYRWPGNVRELQNAIERAVALTSHDQITVEDLPEKIRNYRSSHVLIVADDPTELVPMEEIERRYVLRVMEAVGGNKSQAADVLGFDRKTLYAKLRRYGWTPSTS